MNLKNDKLRLFKFDYKGESYQTDRHGIVKIKDEALAEILKADGFTEVLDVEPETIVAPKVDAPVEELKPDFKEEIKVEAPRAEVKPEEKSNGKSWNRSPRNK